MTAPVWDEMRSLRLAVEVVSACRSHAADLITDDELRQTLWRVLGEAARTNPAAGATAGVMVLLSAMSALAAKAIETVAPGQADEALQAVAYAIAAYVPEASS